MNTLPDSVVQHLSGFLHRSDGMNLACTAKRFRKNLAEAFFEFTVWRRFSLENKGSSGCCERPKVWSCATKTELLKRLMADPFVVRFSVQRNNFWVASNIPMFPASSYTKYYWRLNWVDPRYIEHDRLGHVPPLKDFELF